MRCSSRSTVLSSNRWTTLAQTGVLVVLSLSVVLGESDRTVRVERAIADAVRATMGDVVRVDVTVGQIRLSDAVTAELEARPAPGARLGRRTRFTLYRRPTGDAAVAERVGYAVAEANATIMHLRTGPIARCRHGEVLRRVCPARGGPHVAVGSSASAPGRADDGGVVSDDGGRLRAGATRG